MEFETELSLGGTRHRIIDLPAAAAGRNLWIARESRVRHAPSGPCTRLDTTRWVCRWGSPARESQWSNAAAMTPCVSVWTTPPAPWRVRMESASIMSTT